MVALLAAGHGLAQLAGPLGPPIVLGILAIAAGAGYVRLLDALGTR